MCGSLFKTVRGRGKIVYKMVLAFQNFQLNWGEKTNLKHIMKIFELHNDSRQQAVPVMCDYSLEE